MAPKTAAKIDLATLQAVVAAVLTAETSVRQTLRALQALAVALKALK